jgi:hypothetical protein
VKYHNFFTSGLKIFLFGLFCGSFQFVPQFPVVSLYSSVFTFFHFLHSCILLITSCVIHDFLSLFSTLTSKSLIVSKTHSFVFFYFTSTFQLSHSISPSFSSRVSCTLCL